MKTTAAQISAALNIRLNQEWKRPPGRPRTTWLRTVEEDLAPLDLGLHTAWPSARNGVTWRLAPRREHVYARSECPPLMMMLAYCTYGKSMNS